MITSKISLLSKVLLLATSLLFIGSLFYPMWQIELEAPQYPEGLVLKLHAHKIGGDVEIINGLNHYIGMKTLHSENFIEFTILPYIMGAFALAALLLALVAGRKSILGLFIAFILFGILAACDFYRWNYDYGHDLDPTAAIQVPGMAYQPPLIGYKQLLNFGAYSIPDIGGWMLIGAGILMFIVIFCEFRLWSRFKKRNAPAAAVLLLGLAFLSCNRTEPLPIKLNTDSCAFCKMSISNGKFGAELITQKGRYYKFDDVSCMLAYSKANTSVAVKAYFVNDYLKENTLLPAEKSFFLNGGSIYSPMRGNTAAFETENSMLDYQARLNARPVRWAQLLKASE